MPRFHSTDMGDTGQGAETLSPKEHVAKILDLLLQDSSANVFGSAPRPVRAVQTPDRTTRNARAITLEQTAARAAQTAKLRAARENRLREAEGTSTDPQAQR